MAKVYNQHELKLAVKVAELLNSINNDKEFGTEDFHVRAEIHYSGDFTGTVVQLDGDYDEYGVSFAEGK